MNEPDIQKQREADRKEREDKLRTKRAERAVRRLQEPLRERLQRERAERKESKSGKEPAAKEFDALLQKAFEVADAREAGINIPFDQPAAVTRFQQQIGGNGFGGPPAKPNPQKFQGIPVDFYCWKEGKIAVITLYSQGEPSFL